jgi:hypothetical protein
LVGEQCIRISLGPTIRFDDGQARRKSGRFLGVLLDFERASNTLGVGFFLMIISLRMDADLPNFNSLTIDP